MLNGCLSTPPTGHHSVKSFERYAYTVDSRRREAVERMVQGTGWALDLN